MPSGQAELLAYQHEVVAVASVIAIPFGLRHHRDGVFGAGVALCFPVCVLAVMLFSGLGSGPPHKNLEHARRRGCCR
jgi:hypothetical protein